MDCRNALAEANGDLAEAEVVLRKKGIASAGAKAGRSTRQGVIGAYMHAGSQLGVLVEVNCESDFVARTAEFQELVHDLAMQVAATDPKFVRRQDVPAELLEKEKEIARARALAEGKKENVLDRIVAGRLEKFYEEVCLLEQPFIKDNSLTVENLIKTRIARLRENIALARFVRFKVGDTAPVDGPPEASDKAAS